MQISSQKIKDELARNRLTQAQLAEKIGVSRQNLNIWLGKGAIKDPTVVEKIAEILNVTVKELTVYDLAGIPYYDIDISAGDIAFWNDQARLPAGYVQVPGLEADFVVPIHGHSMNPEISSGDWVAVKQINDLSFFHYGVKHVIVTAEQRMLKYIRKHEDPEKLLLTSRNEDFDDIDLPIQAIQGLFMVVQVLKREVI